MHKTSYYIVNAITLYRLAAAPVLVLLIVNQQIDLFKWLLAVSFFTDAIDGYLARRSKAVSMLGARLDSIADDLTIVAAIVGMLFLKPAFVKQEIVFVILLAVLYVIQTGLAIIRYGRISSFHTYVAKVAAVLQAAFLLHIFFLETPIMILFYVTVVITAIDLVEEAILVLLLPPGQKDVRGLYWVIKEKRNTRNVHSRGNR